MLLLSAIVVAVTQLILVTASNGEYSAKNSGEISNPAMQTDKSVIFVL